MKIRPNNAEKAALLARLLSGDPTQAVKQIHVALDEAFNEGHTNTVVFIETMLKSATYCPGCPQTEERAKGEGTSKPAGAVLKCPMCDKYYDQSGEVPGEGSTKRHKG